MPLARTKSSGEKVAEFGIEGGQADGILLTQQEIAQSRGQRLCIFEFRVILRAVFHGLTAIKHKPASQIRFILKTLDVVPVTSSEQLPVQELGVITNGIGAILRKLNGKTMEWTPVQSAVHTFNDRPCSQFKVFDFHQGCWIEGMLRHGFGDH